MSSNSSRIAVSNILTPLAKDVERERRLIEAGKSFEQRHKETLEHDRDELRRSGIVAADWTPNETNADHDYWDEWSERIRQVAGELETVGESAIVGQLLTFCRQIDDRDEVTCESDFRFEKLDEWLTAIMAGNTVTERGPVDSQRPGTAIEQPAAVPGPSHATSTGDGDEISSNQVKTGILSQGGGSEDDQTGNVAAKVYCMSWREILDAVGQPNDDEMRNRVRNLNDIHDGPIIFGGRGSQPKVEQSKLIKWWNGLEDRFHELAARVVDKKATVAAKHNYGRDDTVVPDIAGHEKQRRTQTSEKVGKHPKTPE